MPLDPPTSTGGTGGRSRGDREQISKKLRFKVLRRCGFKCRYCGCPSTEVRLDVDHIVPVSRGGTNAESNLTASCRDCNIGKGANPAGIPPSVSFLSWLLAQAERHDWVGDLARDEIQTPSLREPDGLRDLVAQIRTIAGVHLRDGVLSAAWHAWREWSRRGGRPTLLMRRLQAPFEPIEIETIAESMGARVLRVADVQLKEWSKGPLSVWESLYVWLVSLGFQESPGPGLHSRTYCGDALMVRLREIETARLRGKQVGGGWSKSGQRLPKKKLCGEDLKIAVSWSDAGSGPMGTWRGNELVGDVLFVLKSKEQGRLLADTEIEGLT